MTPEPTSAKGQGLRGQVALPRRRLGLAVVMVFIGSFLPWLDTGVGAISGLRGPGLWTFYAAMIGLAGIFVPLRWLAAAQASVMGIVCVGLPVWQVARALRLLGTQGWLPGPGVVMVFGGGVLACVAAWQLWQEHRAAA